MIREYDVAVIGIGMAGSMAAITASMRGCNVAIVAHGFGATALSSGCIDILGYVNGNYVKKISKALKELESINMKHPYIVIGRGWKGAKEILDKALNALLRELNKFYEGDLEMNRFILTHFGTYKPTALIQRTMRNSTIEQCREFNRILVLGIEGYLDFDPQLFIAFINRFLHDVELRAKFIGTRIKLNLNNNQNLTSTIISQSITDFETFKKLKNELRKIVISHNPDLILIPAILSTQFREAVTQISELESSCKCVISELPAPLPSVPGLRIQNLLLEILRNKGIDIYLCREVKVLTHNSKCITIKCIRSYHSKKTIEIKARNFVIATGDIVSGGIRSTYNIWHGAIIKEYRETLLNIPLYIPVHKKFVDIDFFNTDKHSILEIGIEINEDLKPVFNNEVLFDNLYAAGSILAHYNFIAEKCGLGVAIATGYRAGIEASKS